MSKNSLTDAGVGRALFTTRVRLSLQAALMCFTFGALPAFCIPYVFWFVHASGHEVDIVRLHAMAALSSPVTPHRWRIRDSSGERRVLTVERADGVNVQWLTAPQAQEVLRGEDQPMQVFRVVIWVSACLSAMAYFAIWIGLRRMGSGRQQNRRLRGANTLISSSELDAKVRAQGSSPYKLVDVSLPEKAPMEGIFALGAQGSGKSIALHDLMQQVFRKKRKCIIYDQSGEYFQAYFRPDKDFFFNPACLGSVPWSIFSELKYQYDADTLALAFLPSKPGSVGGHGAFFENAARAVFSVLLVRLARLGATNTRDIARAFLEMPADEMNHLIQHSVASSAIGGDSKQQRQGVISSIAIYLNGIDAVKPGDWSIRDFIDGPDDSRLFILGTDDTKAMFAPLYRLLLTISFNLIASKQEKVFEDRYWFFLDEVHSLEDIRLDDQLATLRKYGVCIASGTQSDTQLVASVGKERAATIMNGFNTVLLLRANEDGMQERSAKRLGKVEMDTVGRSQALAVTEWRDGAGLNNIEGEKWLVMPSEFGGLQACTGFLKYVGSLPAARVDYRSWLPRRPGGAARVNRFKPVVPLPKRDPSFLVLRDEPQDAFARVREEFTKVQAANKAAADAEAAATAPAPAAVAAAAATDPSLTPDQVVPPVVSPATTPLPLDAVADVRRGPPAVLPTTLLPGISLAADDLGPQHELWDKT